MREYDVVRLKQVVADVPIEPGTRGAILIVHDASPPAYEVEFIDDGDESLGTFTVQARDLELVA